MPLPLWAYGLVFCKGRPTFYGFFYMGPLWSFISVVFSNIVVVFDWISEEFTMIFSGPGTLKMVLPW